MVVEQTERSTASFARATGAGPSDNFGQLLVQGDFRNGRLTSSIGIFAWAAAVRASLFQTPRDEARSFRLQSLEARTCFGAPISWEPLGVGNPKNHVAGQSDFSRILGICPYPPCTGLHIRASCVMPWASGSSGGVEQPPFREVQWMRSWQFLALATTTTSIMLAVMVVMLVVMMFMKVPVAGDDSCHKSLLAMQITL